MSYPQIYLASASPRRRTLLEQIGVRYQLVGIAVEEAWDGRESPRDHVLRLALEKARAGWRCLAAPQAAPVLGADTVVVVDGEIVGKPASQEQGLAMLEQLSGRSHEVLTAVALVNGSRHASRLSISTVSFSPTTAAQRAAYWATGEPHDKAGGYAIQGRAAAFIARLEGSYSGVMGLPLFETAALLAEFGVDIFIAPA
ncbi:MAG TPA: Maf family protein [Gammaproteobacteria bacterium]|nr:Maf family protein [Gammaproteobacteria bacterium]